MTECDCPWLALLRRHLTDTQRATLASWLRGAADRAEAERRAHVLSRASWPEAEDARACLATARAAGRRLAARQAARPAQPH